MLMGCLILALPIIRNCTVSASMQEDEH